MVNKKQRPPEETQPIQLEIIELPDMNLQEAIQVAFFAFDDCLKRGSLPADLIKSASKSLFFFARMIRPK